jgi:hypothetical protein
VLSVDELGAMLPPAMSGGGDAAGAAEALAHEHDRYENTHLPLAHVTAWYTKTTPTFSDALALVRRHLWTLTTFPTSLGNADGEKVPRALLTHLADLLCYAA